MSTVGDTQYLYQDSSYGYVRYKRLGKDWIELDVFAVISSTKYWEVPAAMPTECRPSNAHIWLALRTTYDGVPVDHLAFVEISSSGVIKIQALSELTNGCVRGKFIYFIPS